VRHRKLTNGDLNLNFFDSDYFPQLAQTTKNTNERFGLRHDFLPGLTLLASYMHQQKDIDFSLPDPGAAPPNQFALTRNEKADSVEAQLLYRSERVKAVGGGGYFKIRSNETDAIDVFPAPEVPVAVLTNTTVSDTTIGHTNLYLYSYVAPATNLTLTLGLSADLLDESGTSTQDLEIPGLPPGGPVPAPAAVLGKRNQANPKAGILWTSPGGTTLRAAVFRTLKRTLVTDQTLEPTQVAGFNQFFDDISGTRSWVYGAAVDQKFGKKAFAGAEFSARDLTIPQVLIENNVNAVVSLLDGKERVARAYLLGAPHPWLTLSAEYQYEDLKQDPQLFLQYSRVKTHRVPLSARFFHPCGLGASLSATFLDQNGDFYHRPAPGVPNEYDAGSRNFWVLDAALRYRLPQRYGFIVAGVNNLTDEQSTYQASDPKNLQIRPGRVVYARVVLAFP
jgi:hypothetical protein